MRGKVILRIEKRKGKLKRVKRKREEEEREMKSLTGRMK